MLDICRMRSFLGVLLLIFFATFTQAQQPGIIAGNIVDEKQKALESATVSLLKIDDPSTSRSLSTDVNGFFRFENIGYGYYRLKVSYSGLKPVSIDSIHFRPERFDFNMNDIVLRMDSSMMEEIIIYAEKPLIQNKDGNITFNAGESTLSASSNASELLSSVPLVTKDPTGKILVRGKEPKILIDDKPVELNLEQLQDLLESMPGSSIEKIEVMTNPPAQYAMEQGGVINITTKKGTIGMSGRISIYAGTRGDAGMNGGFNYRKQGLAVNINAGAGYNEFDGGGYSKRQNIYPDSVNYFNTNNDHLNKNIRPNFRTNINYDLNKYHSLNLVYHFNQNNFDNQNIIENINLDRFETIYRLRERTIESDGKQQNHNLNSSYTFKSKKQGESLKFIAGMNISAGLNSRDFFEQYLNPDHSSTGIDSTQQQITDNNTKGYNFRINYDLPLNNKKTNISAGSHYNFTRSDINANAYYKRKTDGEWAGLDALTNHFLFKQSIFNLRASVKQVLAENFSITAGLSAEETKINFDLFDLSSDTANSYMSYLPFGTLNKSWKDVLNLTFSYRRTIRRPNIGQLNPTIDFSDPYNIRFGNPGLAPSIADNFDMVVGRSSNAFYVNLGLGYNDVKDIFNTIRTRLNNDTTQVTWQNISGRKEYEVSTWSGYTFSKKTRVNLSASYTYNTYSDFDKQKKKYRDGGSFTSNLNMNYMVKDIYTATGSFTYNRFANPQGKVNSSLSMNLGLQAKMIQKKLTVTLNIIDPFVQHQNRSYTYGSDFNLENYNQTNTRNFKLSLGYNLSKTSRVNSKKKKEMQ